MRVLVCAVQGHGEDCAMRKGRRAKRGTEGDEGGGGWTHGKAGVVGVLVRSIREYLRGLYVSKRETTGGRRLHQFLLLPLNSTCSHRSFKLDSLPYTALPLSFNLYSPLGASSSPSACLSIRLPIKRSPSVDTANGEEKGDGDGAVVVQDLREGAEEPFVDVVRTLDPEPREPFVSLSRIFLACSVTPLEGLLRFDLDPLAYDLTLSGLAPFLELWVPLALARSVVAELGREDELAALLEWETRAAWTVEDKEEGGIVHNWKVPSSHIDPQSYSTALMLSTPFPRLTLLPSQAQVRTLLPTSPSGFPAAVREGSWEQLWGRFTEWSVREYEAYLERRAERDEEGEEGDGTRSPLYSPQAGSQEADDDLTPLFTFSTLTSLLSLLSALPPSITSSSTRTHPNTLTHLTPLSLSRTDFLPPSPSLSLSPLLRQKATLHFIDALSRIVSVQYCEAQMKEIGERRGVRKREEKGRERREREEGEWREGFERRMEEIEEDMRAGKRVVGTAAPAGEREGEDEMRRLRNEVRNLQLSVKRLAAASSVGSSPSRSRSSLASSAANSKWVDTDWEGRTAVFVAVFVLGLAIGAGLAGQWSA